MKYAAALGTSVKNIWKKQTLYVLAINLLFFFILFQTISYSMEGINQDAVQIRLPDTIEDLTTAQTIKQQITDLKHNMMVTAMLAAFVILTAWTISRWAAWGIALGEKIDHKIIPRTALTSLISIGALMLIGYGLVLSIKKEYLGACMMILYIVFLHYNWIGGAMIVKNKTKKTLKEMLRIGTKKIHLLIIPYLAIISVFGILFSALSLGIAGYTAMYFSIAMITTLSQLFLANMLKEIA